MSIPINNPSHAEIKKASGILGGYIRQLSKIKKDIDNKLYNQTLPNCNLIFGDIDIDIDSTDFLEEIGVVLQDEGTKAKYLITSIHNINNYFDIQRKYPPQATTKERTYVRPLDYSIFHRWFSPKCTTIDLDFIEYKGEDIKLIYDVKGGSETPEGMLASKSGNGHLKKWNIYKKVADKFGVPFEIIFYKRDMSQFNVYRIITLNPLEYIHNALTDEEFKKKIEEL